MNEPDLLLRHRLAMIAEDAPTAESVLSTAGQVYRRRLRRRRSAAATVAAVVVVAVVSTISLVGVRANAPEPVAPAPAAGVATVGTRAAPSTTPLPGTALVAFGGYAVTSPVTVPASEVAFDADGPTINQDSASLEVDWSGAEPTAMQTLDITKGTTGTGQVRGYLITAEEPAPEVSAPGYNTRAAGTAVTVSGHSARLLTAPKGSFDLTYGTPAAARIAWQLPDRRWIQVWAVGESPTALTGFASSILERPANFPPSLSVGLTVAGYTQAAFDGTFFLSQMDGPSVTLCKPGQKPDVEGDNCVRIYADVADGGFAQGIAQGSESNAQFQAGTSAVDSGGVPVSVNQKWRVAWTRWGRATIVVQAPTTPALTSAELAALAASVRLLPQLPVHDDPNPLVESSLSAESAAAAATAHTTGPTTAPATAPTTAPTG